MISVNNTVLQGRALASWNMAVADPDLQITGGAVSKKNFFGPSALILVEKEGWARAPPLDPLLHCVPFKSKSTSVWCLIPINVSIKFSGNGRDKMNDK